MHSFKVIAVILFYIGCIGYGVNCETTAISNDLSIKPSESDVNITSIPLLQEESVIVQEVAKTEQKNETTSTTTPLPNSTAVQQEHNNSMAIFFVLCVIALGMCLWCFIYSCVVMVL